MDQLHYPGAIAQRVELWRRRARHHYVSLHPVRPSSHRLQAAVRQVERLVEGQVKVSVVYPVDSMAPETHQHAQGPTRHSVRSVSAGSVTHRVLVIDEHQVVVAAGADGSPGDAFFITGGPLAMWRLSWPNWVRAAASRPASWPPNDCT